MSRTLDEMIERAKSLTLEEQLRLAAHLVQHAVEVAPALLHQPTGITRHRWSEIRGLARQGSLSEDAQAWVSRTRREADQHRTHPWSDKP